MTMIDDLGPFTAERDRADLSDDAWVRGDAPAGALRDNRRARRPQGRRRFVSALRRGTHAFQDGGSQDALASRGEAQAAYARLGLELEAARCTAKRANVLAGQGRFQEALSGCDEAQAVLVRLGRESEAAGCTMNRAVAQAHLGRFEDALAELDKAEAALVRLGAELEAARCRANRAQRAGQPGSLS